MSDFPKQSFNAVKCSSEPLSKIFWQGRQWAVTSYGIERRDGGYAIGAKHFFETHNGWIASGGVKSQEEGWIKHVGEKEWCDIRDFENAIAAFLILFDRTGKRTKVKAPSRSK